MSDSSKKKDENSEVRDNVEPVSLSQGQVQERSQEGRDHRL